jgi:prepilin-type processing-associated H-X9-DG protein
LVPAFPPKARRAATLIEGVAVIAILGVLTGLLLSAVQRVRATAARTDCANNLRQIGLAAQHYDAAKSRLPPGYAWLSGKRDKAPRDALVGWPVLLLPYLDQQPLWESALAAYGTAYGYSNPPHVGLATVVKTYVCAADSRLSSAITDAAGNTVAYGSYRGVSGSGLPVNDPANGALRQFTGVAVDEIRDGTSHTLLIGEHPPAADRFAGSWYSLYVPEDQFGPYYYGCLMFATIPYDIRECRGPFTFGPGRLTNPCDGYHFWSLHPGGANFAFCDGSVRFLSYSAAPVLPALATRAGGEVVDLP